MRHACFTSDVVSNVARPQFLNDKAVVAVHVHPVVLRLRVAIRDEPGGDFYLERLVADCDGEVCSTRRVSAGERPIIERCAPYGLAVESNSAAFLEKQGVRLAEMPSNLLHVCGAEGGPQLGDLHISGSCRNIRDLVNGHLPIVVTQPFLSDIELVRRLSLVPRADLDVLSQRNACALPANPKDTDDLGVGSVSAAAGRYEQPKVVERDATRTVLHRDELARRIERNSDYERLLSLIKRP